MPAAKGKASGSKGKKGGSSAKAAGSKSRNQLKTKKKAATPKAKPKKPVSKKPAPAKPAKKKLKAKPAPARKTAKPPKTKKPAPKPASKPVPKAAAKPSAKPAPKAAPAKKAKPVATVKKAAAAAGKTIQKAAKTIAKPVAAAATAATAAAATVVKKVVAEAAPKKSRRARTRTHSDGAPIANWIQPNAPRPRPSSFIPAPPRAEAPSNTAAPPASSDRIIRPDDLVNLALPAIRTFPIRVEIEQSTGRTHIIVQPNEIQIRPGDGVEWDFRYLGGADTFVDDISIEFDHKLFAKQAMKSKNPGSARPHRLLSGRLADSAATGTYNYRVRCKSLVGTQVAETLAVIIVG